MHRRRLLDLLGRYLEIHPEERARVDTVRRFVRLHPDCFERTCAPGHVTGSAWILSSDHRQVLLTHHRKLDRWLQLGGHADGERDPLRVALREAREESGMERFESLPAGRDSVPLDVDVHRIPARPGESAHLHLGVRFLMVAAPGQPLRISDESQDLRWFDRERLGETLDDESQLRMERHARRRLSTSPVAPGGRATRRL
jgi:8-oxo-dGTP pyrophosphatase MutT (NUDIX family)